MWAFRKEIHKIRNVINPISEGVMVEVANKLACPDLSGETTFNLFVNTYPPQNGDIAYSDQNLTNPFNGGDLIYTMYTPLEGGYTMFISSTGVISNVSECSALTFNGVLEVDDCNDTSGQNTLIDATGYYIGGSVTIQGTATPFNGGGNWYLFTFGGNNQFYNSISGLGRSTYIVQINSSGIITAQTNC